MFPLWFYSPFIFVGIFFFFFHWNCFFFSFVCHIMRLCYHNHSDSNHISVLVTSLSCQCAVHFWCLPLRKRLNYCTLYNMFIAIIMGLSNVVFLFDFKYHWNNIGTTFWIERTTLKCDEIYGVAHIVAENCYGALARTIFFSILFLLFFKRTRDEILTS